jgi:uncharacterized delta-60 repeat protein
MIMKNTYGLRYLSNLKFVLLVFLLILPAYGAGEVDSTFNVAAYQIAGSSATPPMKAQPDGKFLIAFFEYGVNNGIAAQGISRFNADGTVDASFNAPHLATGTVASFGLQSNGKILIRGNFTIENSPYSNIARLNTDGSLDTTFNVITTPLPHEGFRIFVNPDDSFYTGSLYKFDANGVPDNTFQYQPFFATITNIVGLPDGRVYAGGEVPMSSGFDFLARHNPDGTRDNSFNGLQPNSNIRKIIVLPDGKLLIAGPFTNVNAQTVGGIARINPDGSFDSTFNPGGAGANAPITDMELLPDGKILIGGSFDTYNGVTRRKVARLNSDGTLDTSFNYTGPFNNVFVQELEVFPNGKIAVGGTLFSAQQLSASFITLNSDGSQVPEFFVQKAFPQRVRKTTVQSDGKIYVAGEFLRINGYQRNSLARLNANGTVDTSFVPFLNSLSATQIIHQVIVQPDGKILVSMSHSFVVVRLNSDGSRDTSFTAQLTSAGAVYDIALQADGKILIAGDFTVSGGPSRFARLNADGSLDSGFNPPVPNNSVFRVLVQPDGKSIICGNFTQTAMLQRVGIARHNADGTPDLTFQANGNGGVYDMDLQADGKLVVGGAFTALNGNTQRNKIGRLNSDGSIDTSFAQTVDAIVQTVKVQPDGKVLIGGLFANVGGTPRERLARLNPNGSVDSTFNASANAMIFDINLQADGKILVAGDFTKINNVTKLGVARLLNTNVPARKLFDYDGDGKSDISVFRPTENKWYVLRSSDGQVTQQVFAIAGDVPVPSDYDGDGKTDFAIFRPSSGDFWYLSSINSSQNFVDWGQSGDAPRSGDFDGDGKSDFIVFRPSTNFWHRITNNVNSTVSNTQFGLTGDKPVLGDFDGDGKVDNAIFRPSTGDWWYQSSINNAQLAVRWGISTDIPAPADYDGDGKTDFAVYRPSTGTWYIINSSNGSFTIMNFGISEDKPVPADYDGDGKADIAVFRPSTGVWYMQRSTAGFAAVQFGVSTDIPTPNAFVP